MYGGPKNGKVKITMKPTSDGPSEGDWYEWNNCLKIYRRKLNNEKL
jgi:hypothetical protein